RLAEPRGQRVTANRAGCRVVLPAGSRQVAANDALDRQHLEPPALGRASVRAESEQMVLTDLSGAGEPESGQAREDTTLVGYVGRQHDVERRDAVTGDEQQPLVVEGVELANLPAAHVECGLR